MHDLKVGEMIYVKEQPEQEESFLLLAEAKEIQWDPYYEQFIIYVKISWDGRHSRGSIFENQVVMIAEEDQEAARLIFDLQTER